MTNQWTNRENTSLILIPEKRAIKQNTASSLIAPLNPILHFGTRTWSIGGQNLEVSGGGRSRVCEGKRPRAASLNIHDLKRRINQARSLHVTDITEEISSFAARDRQLITAASHRLVSRPGSAGLIPCASPAYLNCPSSSGNGGETALPRQASRRSAFLPGVAALEVNLRGYYAWYIRDFSALGTWAYAAGQMKKRCSEENHSLNPLHLSQVSILTGAPRKLLRKQEKNLATGQTLCDFQSNVDVFHQLKVSCQPFNVHQEEQRNEKLWKQHHSKQLPLVRNICTFT